MSRKFTLPKYNSNKIYTHLYSIQQKKKFMIVFVGYFFQSPKPTLFAYSFNFLVLLTHISRILSDGIFYEK